MTILEINKALADGRTDEPGVLPKLDQLADQSIVFPQSFGLDQLPVEPGIIMVRGARQYGKSTWLQQMIRHTVDTYGPGTAFYLNGDEIRDAPSLQREIRSLVPLYRSDATLRRLFIDEVTAVPDWEVALKILADHGELRRILVVTTGSRAADLRHGAERLPGRKGRLPRSTYVFTPIAYRDFAAEAEGIMAPSQVLPAYIISGGSPVACLELVDAGRLPDYVIELVRDWVYGSFAREGRSRSSLLGVLDCLFRFAGTPVGQSKLAREAGLANNTVAAGYTETLGDLLSVGFSYPWDIAAGRAVRRRPCKFHFTNTLVATAWHPLHARRPAEFVELPPDQQGGFLEWTVAQELFRRAAVRGDELPEMLPHWASREHEIDFVITPESFVEVKRGRTSPLEFAWFPQVFSHGSLTVISESRYETERIRGITLSDFLSGDAC